MKTSFAAAAGLVILSLSACGGAEEVAEPPTTTVADTTTTPVEATTTEVTAVPPRTGVEKLCAKYHELVDDDGDGWGKCERSEVPSTSSTIFVPPLGPYSESEVQALIAPPADAWISSPSGTTYDALSLVAQSILDSGREIPRSNGVPMDVGLRCLSTYPGSDETVVNCLLGMSIAVPVQLDGTFTVGVDIQPGTYKTLGSVDGCYWETLDDAGEINDNNFVMSAPQVMMTVRSRDFAVHMEDCGPWIKIG